MMGDSAADKSAIVRNRILGYLNLNKIYAPGLSSEETAEKVRKRNGAINGTLNKVFGGDENRRLVLSFLFSNSKPPKPISSKSLSESQWMALYQWIDWWKNPDTGEWLTQPNLQKDALDLLNGVLGEYGKMRLHLQRAFERDPHSFVDHLVMDQGGEITRLTEEIEGLPPFTGDLPDVRGRTVPVRRDIFAPPDNEVEW